MRSHPMIRWQAPVARLLAAVLMVVSAGPLLHAADGHDVDCAPTIGLHDCTQHDREISANDDSTLPGVHCAACHFGRQARSVSGLGQGVFHLFAGSARVADEGVRVPHAAAVRLLPARAPPAALLG